MVYWNHRMNLLEGDAKYADIVEREMYNGALSGISLSGDQFFYVNPLVSTGDHHRTAWYDTSCCPTNLARFLPSIGQYVYALTDDGIAVNQYIDGESEMQLSGDGPSVRIIQRTNYPWNGRIELEVQLETTATFTLKLRIPGWCKSYQISAGDTVPKDIETLTNDGYLVLQREWVPGQTIVLELDMPVEAVRARSEVVANRERVAIQRGPVVYCLEAVDNPEVEYDSLAISAHQPMAINDRPELLGGVVTLSGRDEEGRPITLIPYYACKNLVRKNRRAYLLNTLERILNKPDYII